MSKCLLYSLSKITGIPIEAILEQTKGIEDSIIDPLAIGANRFRGVHVQEIVDLAFRAGWALVEIEADPRLHFTMTDGTEKNVAIYTEPLKRFEWYLQNFDGILLGAFEGSFTGHAVAWKNRQMFDLVSPPQQGRQFQVEAMLALTRMQHPFQSDPPDPPDPQAQQYQPAQQG